MYIYNKKQSLQQRHRDTPFSETWQNVQSNVIHIANLLTSIEYKMQ